MSSNTGSSNETAPNSNEEQHKKFLKTLEENLEKNNFPEDQSKKLLEEASKIKPGDAKALVEFTKKLDDVFRKNTIGNATDEDLEEFLVFAKATGIIPQDADPEEFEDSEKKDFISKFKQWVKKGKPAAVNPLEDEEPERILRVSRRREFGKQFLTYIVSGEDKPRGIVLIPTYRKYKLNNQVVEDRSTVVSTKPRYTITYSKPKAEELMKRCIEESETPSFTFKQGGRTTTIRDPKNFIGDFDEVMKKAVKGDPV